MREQTIIERFVGWIKSIFISEEKGKESRKENSDEIKRERIRQNDYSADSAVLTRCFTRSANSTGGNFSGLGMSFIRQESRIRIRNMCLSCSEMSRD